MMKFKDRTVTAKGEERAFVDFGAQETLWFNTGTLCNLECRNCYIESSPRNDALVYLDRDDIRPFLKELREGGLRPLIGFTGGEPFLNPQIMQLLAAPLEEGLETLVLTNAYRVVQRHRKGLLALKETFGPKLKIRVSLDHHTREVHERERGPRTFLPTLSELRWLAVNGFAVSLAARMLAGEDRTCAERELKKLLHDHGIAELPTVHFPEMQKKLKEETPEISVHCWGILRKDPQELMCARERMVVKRKGEDSCVVLPCTLLAHDRQFELGKTLRESRTRVYLNHPFCSQFCALGGSSCSRVR